MNSQGSIESCCICQEPIITRGEIEGCKHMFCYNCILKWSTHENSCPICRQRFPSITKIVHPFSQTPQIQNKLQVETKDQSNHQEEQNAINIFLRNQNEIMQNVLANRREVVPYHVNQNRENINPLNNTHTNNNTNVTTPQTLVLPKERTRLKFIRLNKKNQKKKKKKAKINSIE